MLTIQFLNIVAKWPGSTPDSFIWSNCDLAFHLEHGRFGEGWLLGDSLYPLKPYLLTPLQNPVSPQERAYNRAHKKTRCLIERTFRIWKMRFLYLHKYGGCLMFSPERCVKVIITTCILHNICIKRRLALVQERVEVDDPEDENEIVENQGDDDGRATRNALIANVFHMNV